MILDALSAELLKLRRNRVTFFWAFGLTPAATLVFGILMSAVWRSSDATFAELARAAPVFTVMGGLGAPANLFVQLFLIIGAATLFAGEYRWETWRAVLPRTQRRAILTAKLLAFAIYVSASILACGVASACVSLFEIAITGLPPSWPSVGAGQVVLAMLLALAASVLQVMWTCAFAALAAIVSRSILACAIGTFVTLAGLEIAASRVAMSDGGAAIMALPNLASRAIREQAFALLGDVDAVGGHLAAPCAAVLVLSTAALFGLAVLVFQRQDLSRE